jgi:LmbE family N-acetylglucosaminyl deacetylase
MTGHRRRPLKSVAAFFAHPDDESVLAGGMTALLTSQGIPVNVVIATRGEGGELGEPPVVTDRSALGAVRERELRCAAKALGANVMLWDYVDPVIGPDDVLQPFAADFDTLAGQIASFIRQHDVDLVLTHGGDGEYGHPAHQLVHRAVVHAVQRLAQDVLLYSVAANVPSINDRLWNKNELAHLAIDIRPWASAKIQAMECHVSQHALFKRQKKLETVAEALRPVESVRRVLPSVGEGDMPQDAFADLLRTAGAWQPDPIT